ncbi:RNA polymerase sporulation sigma factor SigF [Cellulosilyticum lentocellum]|uniref:RNA polymerase sigma factor n=1 Tax=Cellulosilyticum lentocellum (strain ATCC 49066 / DSM 5427 / NCIMB 11756 / RHM5) TaxID=642492 RepID=F2JJ31_CELLD|nr:RNA polymerase sporulation sigma factor SigF [Cellulosilyticum lentocellum]ADZ83190.1 RNA polymerase, sigma 28 subunit, SigF [Cellulosilyticum lentocellum DSM 5427]
MDHTLELIQRAQQGDEIAKNILVQENLGLVWSLVRRFSNRGYDMEDLFQIGSIGLLKSIDKFDLSFNVKFSTYAVPMIVGEIKRFLRDDGMIKVSRSLKETAYKVRILKDELIRELNREPTISEIAAGLDLQVEEVVEALESNAEIESLNAVIYQGDGKPITLSDKIDEVPTLQNSLVDKMILTELIERLLPIEREIIHMRYFEDRTQTEIASALDISQVQVSRIEKRILKKMREMLGS